MPTVASSPTASFRSAFWTTRPRRRRPKGYIVPTKPTCWLPPRARRAASTLLIAELVPPPLSERIPGDIIWTLKLGTIFSAIVCFLIAHYLTKPIERLRNATHQLARGNLDIVVGANLGHRRDEIADLVRDFDTMAAELRKQIKSERNLLERRLA